MVSCCWLGHAADLLLTDKDGKQDAKEDDDENEQHEVESQSVRVEPAGTFMPRAGSGGYDITGTESRAEWVAL